MHLRGGAGGGGGAGEAQVLSQAEASLLGSPPTRPGPLPLPPPFWFLPCWVVFCLCPSQPLAISQCEVLSCVSRSGGGAGWRGRAAWGVRSDKPGLGLSPYPATSCLCDPGLHGCAELPGSDDTGLTEAKTQDPEGRELATGQTCGCTCRQGRCWRGKSEYPAVHSDSSPTLAAGSPAPSPSDTGGIGVPAECAGNRPRGNRPSSQETIVL